MENENQVQVPEAYAEATWIPEGGFESQDQVFDTINTLHEQANSAPVVPEEYKEKGWAGKKFESVNDLYKEIDELSSLKGKKTVPFDFSTATENEIEDHLKITRPENIDAYNWGEESDFGDEDKKAYGEMLQGLGVPPYVGNKMIDFAIKRQNELKSAMFSVEGQEKIFEESFKTQGDWKQIAGKTANSMKENMSEADQKMLENVPNNILGLMYRLHNNTIKNYGIKEGDHRGKGGLQNVSEADLETKRNGLRVKIDEAKFARDHNLVKKLNDELTATYANDPRIKK